MEKDSTYFSRRAFEETAAAATAPHPNAKKAHLEMAERYRELSDAIATHEHSARTSEARADGLPISA